MSLLLPLTVRSVRVSCRSPKFHRSRHRLHVSTIIRSSSSNCIVKNFKVWDSISKRSKELTSHIPNVLTWYSCGPTVYDDAHIGHASSYIRQDVIRRILEGIDGRLCVLQLMGVTDIDDKIIYKSNQLKIPWESISRKYETEFFQDLEKLNVLPPQIKTRVTNFIPQIIHFVQELIQSGNAYVVSDGSVYFDTKKYLGYGKLRKLSEEIDSEEEGKEKRNVKDFAVWKGWKEGEPFWTAPWGKGRPGWHIECSVMASHYFGPKLDMHSGGTDLLFPHHENEEAQCCARFGVDNWVQHWFHTGHLQVKGDIKMSKSLGNTITIRDFLAHSSPQALRMFCIISKYQQDLEFSPESLHHAKSMLKKFESFLSDTEAILHSSKLVQETLDDNNKMWTTLLSAREHVLSSLTNDFDTPSAIHKISEYIDHFNRCIKFTSSVSPKTSNGIIDFGLVLSSAEFVGNFLSLVGIYNRDKMADVETDSRVGIESLLTELNQFRTGVRNFALASDEEDKTIRKQKIGERKKLLEACDDLRTRLGYMGLVVKDHAKGSSLSLKGQV